MDHSLPGSSAHGIFQARVLEWGAIAFSLEMFRMGLWSLPGKEAYSVKTDRVNLAIS